MTKIKRFMNALLKPNAPIGWGRMAGFWLIFAACYGLFKLALFTVQLSEQVRSWSLLILAMAITTLIWGLFKFWKWLQKTSLARLIGILLGAYLVAVLVLGVANAAQVGLFPAIIQSAVDIPSRVSQMLGKIMGNVIQYPGEFSNYYNQDSSFQEEERVIANEPVVVQVPGSIVLESRHLRVEDKIYFSNSAEQLCSLDGLSKVDVFDNEAMILEGPRLVEGTIWWRVGNASGSAWCPADTLLPTE